MGVGLSCIGLVSPGLWIFKSKQGIGRHAKCSWNWAPDVVCIRRGGCPSLDQVINSLGVMQQLEEKIERKRKKKQ